jgi:glucose-6-phosphate 1-dehydrogenase
MTESNETGSFFSKYLKTCDIPLHPYKVEPFTMVIFGGAGDLSGRKLLPALFHLYREDELSAGFSVLGFGRHQITDDQYRAMMKDAVRGFGREPVDDRAWDEFSAHVFFLSGDYAADESYEKLSERLATISIPTEKGNRNVIYYMAVPPQATPVIVEKLKQHNLSRGIFGTKIIVEKPFGDDLPSAVRLNRILTDAFDEKQIFRIDHYLGKETVQNIMFFRFSNAIFERLWNSRYIDNVQITVAEDIGIEHRGAFYEETGVVRDIVQNHIMQLIALVAMEPPIGFEADLIRDEKGKVFRAIRPMDDEYIDRFTVRGQYAAGRMKGGTVAAYREEKGVAPDSSTPTFFAGKFSIANWRWAGVPFYVRTGKRLARQVTEICIQFKQPPLKLFGRTCDILEPNMLTLTIQPEEKISLRFGVKYPHEINKIYPVNMLFSYQDTFKTKTHPAYERLLIDCMKGDLTLFVRQDGVEAMWEALDPLIARWESNPPRDFPNYRAGSWGPLEAELLLQRDERCWLTE